MRAARPPSAAGVHREGATLTTNILLVEDEYLIRLLLSESLVDAGYSVTEAENGDAALAILARGDPVDLVFTDITMTSATDGNDVANEAKRRRPDLPVIYATGRPDSLRNPLGPEDVLIRKPYGPTQVLAIIRRLLEAPPST